MANLVKAINTPASQNEIIQTIISAWPIVFGTTPTTDQVAKTWAQIAIEASRGKYILNNNVGNIDYTSGFKGDYYENTDNYSVNGNPAIRKSYIAKRRAYPTLKAGVIDYLTLLKNRKPVMKALLNGTPADFSNALAEVHYYDPYVRDDYVDKHGRKNHGYTHNLVSIYNQLLNKKTRPEDYAPPSTSSGDNTSLLASFVSKLESFLDNLTSLASASNEPNNFLIEVKSSSPADFASKLEYSRILSFALKEELDLKTNIYTDRNNIQISCENKNIPIENVKEVCAAISDTFTYATRKIGTIKVYSLVSQNTRPNYEELNIKTAEINYRKFNIKFIKGMV
jgi:hypothetical protein